VAGLFTGELEKGGWLKLRICRDRLNVSMKKLFPLLFLLFGSCSTVETYRVGDYSVHIAPHSRVNEEYQKVCIFNCSRTVKGFVNYKEKEMWSVANTEVVIHEVKHIVEGNFHEKEIYTD
jgi:hypothetical protein